MSDLIDVTALWQVLAVSLVAGVGVAVVFAAGLVGLSRYEGWTETGPRPGAAERALGMAAAVVCFAAVLAGVALGILAIIRA